MRQKPQFQFHWQTAAPVARSMSPHLRYQGRTTVALQKLLDGQTTEGARVVRRATGFSDFDVVRGLVRAGWLEARATGPRGGTRYYTTPTGAAAAAAA